MSPRQPDSTLPLFSSDRERRLWTRIVAVVMAIYLTLRLASTLVGKLLERGIYDKTFVLAFFMMWAALLTQGLKVRPGDFT